MQKSVWYYTQGQQRHGPLEAAQIAALIADGTIRPDTMVGREGMANWALARDHFDFATGTTPPPLPQTGQSRVPVVRRVHSASTSTARSDDGAGMTQYPAPPRRFTEAVSVSLRKYFTFSGRASRSEYWYFFLFTVLVGVVTALLDTIFFGTRWDDDVSPLNNLANLLLLLPMLAVGWRRLHDINRSGWWIGGFWLIMFATFFMFMFTVASQGVGIIGPLVALIGIAVLVYFVTMLVFLCSKGDPHPNRFG